MRVLQVFLGRANPERANGVNAVINGLCKFMGRVGAEIEAVGVSPSASREEVVHRDGFDVRVFPAYRGACAAYLRRVRADVVHLHGVWSLLNQRVMRRAGQRRLPYVVTPHAGLFADRIAQSRALGKRWFHALFQRGALSRAAGLHALCREEVTNLTDMTGCRNIFFIPNGQEVPAEVPGGRPGRPSPSERIRFGVLGRSSPEKNLRGLIEAVGRLPRALRDRVECHVIGPSGGDVDGMKRAAEAAGAGRAMVFRGPLYGDEKMAALRSLHFYVQPSRSEGGSISLLEALALGLPVVVTRTSNLSYYYGSGAFIMVEPVPDDLARGIVAMIDRMAEWDAMSARAVDLVRTEFNWERSAKRMLEEYGRILANGPR